MKEIKEEIGIRIKFNLILSYNPFRYKDKVCDAVVIP